MKLRNYQLASLKCANLSLMGYSAAGEETVVIAPELDVAFDIGKCPREAVAIGHVLLTHGHFDHAAGLPYYFAQRTFQNLRPGIALVPAVLVDPLENLLECWSTIDGQMPKHQLVGMNHGEEFALNRNLTVRAFATNHTAPSLGYAIIEKRHKLKTDFLNSSEQELVAHKARGVTITEIEETPLVAYMGDTAPSDFHLLPEVAAAQTLIIECTFFQPDYSPRSRAYKHLHIDDLVRLLPQMRNEHIVITHLSKSVRMSDAKDILRTRLPPELLPRVQFLMG